MFGSSSSEVVSDILTAYSLTMIAQAQECVFLKAESGSIPVEMVAKIASKTRECYEEAWKRCSVPSCRHGIPKEWFSNLQQKVQLMNALAQYQQSKVCGESRAYGEQVARLGVAYDLLKQASRGSWFTRQSMLEQIKRERDAAAKDNDFIYHERVPTAKDLSQVPSDGGIGKIELKLPILGSEVKDIFTDLVPLGFLDAKNQADGMRRSLVALEIQRLREATNELNAVMLSLNLPAAIQVSSDLVPNSLLESAAKIAQLGGAKQLREHVYSLPDSAERNREILQTQKNTLEDEEKTDQNLRQQFGERWVRQPSSKLNEQWKQEIAKMFKFLEETKKTDLMLANRFEENAQLFELLSKSSDEIRQAIKDQQTDTCSSPHGNETARQNLAAVCSQIESMKADRNSLQDQLEHFQLPGEVLDQFLRTFQESNKVPEQEMLDAINAQLEGIRQCVRASLTKQEELLSDLQTKFEAYFGRKKSAESSSLISQLTAAVDSFLALDRDVKEGMKFYAELTDRCLKVQDKIDDFCLARTTEKTEHMADITNNLSRVTVSSDGPTPPTPSEAAKSVAPPDRPPPTYSQPQPGTTTAPATTPSPAQPTPGMAAAAPGSMPTAPFGAAWGASPYAYGMPAYGPPPGMPVYGFYPTYGPGQMPALPTYPGMAMQPGPYTPGQPRPPQP
ncbi:Programmed cell death 6-interacting protein [Fasciolopsis buskii]|uniref:Programmed cell death 6-interacting protein n=1 Tax=Fasciolopsis buskii TaxID=27845 RepID=A0A8E0RVJ9_9TREM|nr:Programmed cell death 6-interacting protein [Fasciolopsis buski]